MVATIMNNGRQIEALNETFRLPENASRRVRVGVVLGSDAGASAPGYEMLNALLGLDLVQVTTVFLTPRSRDDVWSPSALLLRIYRFVDDRFLCRSAEASGRIANLRDDDRLRRCRWIDLGSVADDDARGPSPTEELDVVVCIELPGDVGELCGVARAGVWWIGPSELPDEMAMLREHLSVTAERNDPMREFIWVRTAEEDRPFSIAVATCRRVSLISVMKNMQPLSLLRNYFLSAELWKLSTRLQDAGSPSWASSDSESVAATSRPAGVARQLTHMGMRQLRHRLASQRNGDSWTIGVRSSKVGEGACHLDPAGYRWLEAPPGEWWADPMLFERDGRVWLFFESYLERLGRGVIVCAEMLPSGAIDEPRIVLERPYHLSYPHVFELDEQVYMIPESGTNGTVELYAAIAFPDKWELVRVLRRGDFFDTTVVQRQDRLWFFTSIVENSTWVMSQLLLFSSDRIDGDWRLHPANPISADARYSRSAGSVFQHRSSLVRPAQDCSETYGGAIQFLCIDSWNEVEYSESWMGTLGADSYEGASGVHTYNRSAACEVIDRK